MLKNKFLKFFTPKNNNAYTDSLKSPIMDGFVDIKGYKVSSDGSKKLIYHDCGDNVVTNWMRHTIMVMFTGSVFSANGQSALTEKTAAGSRTSSDSISMPTNTAIYHKSGSSGLNLDGYILNGGQYFFNGADVTEKYSESTLAGNKYAYFPTKILFGTGKEYSSWSVLQTENESANATWYTEMLNAYGGDVSTAKSNFDENIDLGCNVYSGSISKNIYSGNGTIAKMRTVNDPDTSSSIISSTSTMNKNYGVVGSIKSPYFDKSNDVAFLQSTISDSGKLLKPVNRGIGRPCFLYLNTPQGANGTIEQWDQTNSAEVALSKDSSSLYLNKITFTVTMPSQDSSNNSVGEFYPYNGYVLKQMGLFNDARLTTTTTATKDSTSYPYLNMPCGMLLAVKNITAFEKTADVELKITWTLTI